MTTMIMTIAYASSSLTTEIQFLSPTKLCQDHSLERMAMLKHVKHSRAKLCDGFSNSASTLSLLSEADTEGDYESFLDVLKQNPGVLEDVALVSAETPLDAALASGNIDIVSEILLLKPRLARELNRDGFSPLHLASAAGHLETVKLLMSIGKDLCLLKDKHGATPLHSAAMTGRTDVVNELLGACPESIMAVTSRRETPFHTAVIYNQCDTFTIMWKWLIQMNNLDVINERDRVGNMILHLATSRKQFQTIDTLLAVDPAITAKVDVNATNAEGLTALDILYVLPPGEETDIEIDQTLRRAGALRARDITKLTIAHNNQNEVLINYKSERWNKASSDTIRSSKSEDQQPRSLYNIMLLTAAVMTTATFYPALCPQLYNHDNQGIVSSSLFMFFNSMGFLTSVPMIVHLTVGFPMKLRLLISLLPLFGSYTCSLMVASSPFPHLNAFLLATPAVSWAIAYNLSIWRLSAGK